jgi:prepilin-type N-terminal cleavage/methylation domain-containing protein
VSNARFSRRGATLVELMVAVALLSVIGAATLRMLTSQSRFVDQHTKQRSARGVVRTTMNLMLSELRMVEATGGVESASRSAITVRVPYALGLACGTLGSATVVSFLPADSVALATAAVDGYAWRDYGGRYTYVTAGVTYRPAPDPSPCTVAGITTLPDGRIGEVMPAIAGPAVDGTPVFLFQRIQYSLAPSTTLRGRIAMWRTSLSTGLAEEIAAPFDSSAAFRFFRQSQDTATALPPASLAELRGIELELTGASEGVRAGKTKPELARQRTAIFFANTPEIR